MTLNPILSCTVVVNFSFGHYTGVGVVVVIHVSCNSQPLIIFYWSLGTTIGVRCQKQSMQVVAIRMATAVGMKLQVLANLINDVPSNKGWWFCLPKLDTSGKKNAIHPTYMCVYLISWLYHLVSQKIAWLPS